MFYMTFVGRYIDPFMSDSSFIINLFCVSMCGCLCIVHVSTFTSMCLEVRHISVCVWGGVLE